MQFLSHMRDISSAQSPHVASGNHNGQYRHRTAPYLQKVLVDSVAPDGTTVMNYDVDGAPWSCAIQQSRSSNLGNLYPGLLALSIILHMLRFLVNIFKCAGFVSSFQFNKHVPTVLLISLCKSSSSWILFRD